MATKLGIYNDALIRVGEDVLDDLTEDRDSRHALDAIYDLGAIDQCLEVVRPRFATKTVSLAGSATTGGVTLAYTHTIPTDYITLVGVYSDSELDQPISRYINDGGSLICDYDTIYLRYVHNTSIDESSFTPLFARVVSTFMAREACYKFDPDRYESIDTALQSLVEQAIAVEEGKDPAVRPNASGSALSNAWRSIYNDALLILGKDPLPAGDADHPDRVRLDAAVAAGAVDDVLEDTNWRFGLSSAKIGYDTAVTPAFGYQYAHQKPSELHRIVAISTDEYFRYPLKDYLDEGDYFFCGYEDIYLRYISSGWLIQPDAWPTFFARLVAAKLARNAAPVIDKTLIDHAKDIYDDRKSSALGNDAVQSPPQKIAEGSWVNSRYHGAQYGRGRP